MSKFEIIIPQIFWDYDVVNYGIVDDDEDLVYIEASISAKLGNVEKL